MNEAYKELAALYIELENLLEEFRVERLKYRDHGSEIEETYWQGKKDGLRIALNLIHPFTLDKT